MDYEPSWAERDAKARDARRRLEEASRIVAGGARLHAFPRLRHRLLGRLRAPRRVTMAIDPSTARQE